MTKNPNNLYWHDPAVTMEHRWERYEHKSCILWLTGFSASGKSTLANLLCRQFHVRGEKSYVLDGDNIRHGLNSDLGFGPEDRRENIRRITEVAKLFVDAGLIAITAFISPYREDRSNARRRFREGEFIEVYVKCPISVCEQRDPKGIYQRARRGLIKDFTGISAPYEEPENPELVINTAELTSDQSAQHVVEYLEARGLIPVRRSGEVQGGGPCLRK